MMSPEDRENFDTFRVWIDAVAATVSNLIRVMRGSNPSLAEVLSARFSALHDLCISEHEQAKACLDLVPPDGHAATRHMEVAWAAMMEVKELAEDHLELDA